MKPTRITITIDTDNAPFDGDAGVEVSRILGEIIANLEAGAYFGKRRDIKLSDENGNRTGNIYIEYEGE